MVKPIGIVAFFICLSFQLSAQNSLKIIEGFVKDSTTQEPLMFATVYGKQSKLATITNAEGYFKLEVPILTDTIAFSYIGYKKKQLFFSTEPKGLLQVNMVANSFQIKEVTVVPKTYDFLFKLLQACKKKQEFHKDTSKAYFQLKSYSNGKQIELVEGFYNAYTSGYNLQKIKLKASRIGLRMNENSFFASLETSKAIIKQKLFSSASYFPISPLELNLKQMKKRFYIDLNRSYKANNNDSVYVFELLRKQNIGKYFGLKVWLNASDTSIQKVVYHTNNPQQYPIEPIYEEDQLTDLRLKISKTFRHSSQGMSFEHVDFEYSFNYLKPSGEKHKINTKAVLFLYDDQSFNLPNYGFANQGLSDYQIAGAMPYNSFFWNYHTELQLNEQVDSNELFFNHPETVSNWNYGKKASVLTEFFKNDATRWSFKRMAFKEFPKKTAFEEGEEDYNLKASTFWDFNSYQDSTHLLTAAVFDKSESYYRYYLNYRANCFINLYFDLVELKREELLQNLKGPSLDYASIKKKLLEHEQALQAYLDQYENEVERGRNLGLFQSWNNRVKNKLGIDNVEIFQLEKTEPINSKKEE